MFVNYKVEEKVRTLRNGSAKPTICSSTHGLELKKPSLNIVQYISPCYKGMMHIISAYYISPLFVYLSIGPKALLNVDSGCMYG